MTTFASHFIRMDPKHFNGVNDNKHLQLLILESRFKNNSLYKIGLQSKVYIHLYTIIWLYLQLTWNLQHTPLHQGLDISSIGLAIR